MFERVKNEVPGTEWETGWTLATSIKILATLAALMHDLGKANTGFQKKLLSSSKTQPDPYRHEWISLRLFEAMIDGCTDDQQWLQRLADFSTFASQNPNWPDRLHNDHQHKSKGLAHMPPLAQMVAWLIATHHRLPFDARNFKEMEKLRQKSKFICLDLKRFYKRLSPTNGWVYSEKSHNARTDTEDFWRFSAQASESRLWQKAVARWAEKALNHPPLMQLPEENNPLLMHLSRLCLMVGDHNYSSLQADDKRRVTSDSKLKQTLVANTCRTTHKPKQALDEHLLGVAQFTASFAHLLPRFTDELPRLEDLSTFARRTPIERFQWQNKAWNLVKKHRKPARQQGFFGVNLASTGCGKTLGNARIMAALADPETGLRFTCALGLRVLTLQTGQALRDKLNLDDTALAILVGGAASRTLFEIQQEESKAEEKQQETNDYGSESEEELIRELVDYDHCALDQETLGTIIHDPKARQLLYAPIASCTVDHIIGATETLRGGRHIIPMLRLLTSDLVLDEPDDFDQNDLPALSRLVFMAGMLGSNVLLSSATLTPDLIMGLFTAYQSGRTLWQKNQGETGDGIYCAWIDEFHQHMEACASRQAFEKRHQTFIKKRVKQLQAMPPRRMGDILSTSLPKAPEGEKINNRALADIIINASQSLHRQYHEPCPTTGKTASVGLVRLANINPMFGLAQALYESTLPDQVQIHLCCYHARQLLILRNTLERKLDRILNRNDHHSLLDHREIQEAVATSPKQHHLFIVLATSVAEVGRDHDYDWAIVEPSSMRSIIQLAGRVWRHRPERVAEHPNILILNNNIKALQASNKGPVFFHPGFESKTHPLESHACSELIPEEQLSCIDAIPRIVRPEPLQPTRRLADLEHQVMVDLLNSPTPNYVNVYWQPESAAQASVHMQRISPFRYSATQETEYVAQPDADDDSGIRFRSRKKAWEAPFGEESVNSDVTPTSFTPLQTAISPWLVTELPDALEELAEQLDDDNQTLLAIRFAFVSLENRKNWRFHPWFGFWPR